MADKTDRRRKFAQGDSIRRLTISLPSSAYEKMLKEAPYGNLSAYIRNLITEHNA